MTAASPSTSIAVRQTQPEDFDAIVATCGRVYPHELPWGRDHLAMHHKIFPQGQLVAEDTATHAVVGMAASLIVHWDDYEFEDPWGDFTDHGYFTNHDPAGHTLYGAEVMVDPRAQGQGVGKKLYAARRELCQRLKLHRIRAGARLRGYGKYADQMSAAQYVTKVIDGEIGDPTLSFQLKQGFRVIAVVGDYLFSDPASHGFAAVIEWLNPRTMPTAVGHSAATSATKSGIV